MDNEANIPEDYNNQGIDVIVSPKRDARDCIFDNILNEIQDASLIEATRKAERIGDNTINIIKASNQAKLSIKKNERTPKYINADTIKDAMQNESRTINDWER